MNISHVTPILANSGDHPLLSFNHCHGGKMAKNTRKKKIISIEHARTEQVRARDIEIVPKNLAQETYLRTLNDDQKKIVFAIGPAGTGKTYLAVVKAVHLLKSGQIRKIVLTRPAVSVDEQHGFLPGNLNEKMAPWLLPITDILEKYFSPREIMNMMDENIIEICPLAYIRGRTFHDSFVIFDEAQNSTVSQTKACLTRLGENSRMVVTGDLEQHDRGYEINGLGDFVQRCQNANLKHIQTVYFDNTHVERSEVVKEVLSLYS